ncbi:MAG TPA: transcriptional repressor, partial [Spirochaetota bacterium]|nr:transcriptional repressor [Spirochaetota bacterium]
GKTRYELTETNQGKDHHHHLICTRCNKIIDYTHFIPKEEALIKKTEKALTDEHNFEITGHMLNFYGVCGRCR